MSKSIISSINIEQLQFHQNVSDNITVFPMTATQTSQTGFNPGTSVLHEPICSAGNHFIELIPGLLW